MPSNLVAILRTEYRNSTPKTRYKNLIKLLRCAGTDHKLSTEEIVSETGHLLKKYERSKSERIAGLIIVLNAGIAGQVAQRHLNKTPDLTCRYHDLMQEALTGILIAVRKFDPDKGVPFSSFAYTTANFTLMHYRRNRKGVIKIPQIWGEKYSKVMRARERGGNKQSALDVAISFGIAPDLWRDIEAAHKVQVSSLTEEFEVVGNGAHSGGAPRIKRPNIERAHQVSL